MKPFNLIVTLRSTNDNSLHEAADVIEKLMEIADSDEVCASCIHSNPCINPEAQSCYKCYSGCPCHGCILSGKFCNWDLPEEDNT